MTLSQTPAVRHYSGWSYDFDNTREWRGHWCARYKDVMIYASTEAALKRKIDEWFDKQGD